MNEIATQLTAAEVDYLAECEERIERGLQTFVEVGTALAMIRDNRLYRAGHQSFAAYCEVRWGFTDRRARQIIEAAEIGNMLPVSNARQANELARVPEPDRARVWDAAVEATAGKPTAAAIRAAANDSPSGDGKADVRPAPVRDAESEAPTRPQVGAGETAVEIPVETSGASVSAGPSISADADGEESVHDDSVRADAAGAPTDLDTAGAPVNPSELVNAALDKHVPDTNPHREWQRRYLDAIAGVHKVMRFKADDVAEKADEQLVNELIRIRDQFEEYFAAVIKARVASMPNNVTPIRRIS